MAFPPPPPIPLLDGKTLDPAARQFSAFVFKMQANMDKRHRDRVAFVRITSGVFERGMDVRLERLDKTVKLSSPVTFFGQERSTIDHAYPGDIIGLINPGTFRIGDVLSTGEAPKFRPLPVFAPELFARIILEDTSKTKSFRKGIEQLAEEGVLQVFTRDGVPIVGAVGELQFESFHFRLMDEYNAPCRMEKLPFECSRWIKEENISAFSTYDYIVRDENKNPVVLFKSEYRMNSFMEQNPKIELLEHPPH